ncbi:peptide deformylase [Amycolatopsis granulosa]|uniref:peptide deformylase n=1 Tax=Amycolatopsis granulosa TaxID=185684 RepID=UPI001ABB637E|nr:peptide deformylase [Amycolatopsis granulosa]NIH88209.1 hypothetical protein [Amycolatopsis granulosa]
MVADQRGQRQPFRRRTAPGRAHLLVERNRRADEQYEGCLSFFDVRGQVPRSHVIQVEHTTLDGTTMITLFERARLDPHEVDHLHGHVYTGRIRPRSERSPWSSTAAPAPPGFEMEDPGWSAAASRTQAAVRDSNVAEVQAAIRENRQPRAC